ncbi:hypothetical protein PR202_ga17114 [Eleusine coracana subsp. coracana]|uniref:Uncharacterized protein n=1 Tax=Eleusine coracana subsp. coracana TaxID=191504 RepID=A0AAV5CND9_ELECO|nr:hypothetical protein PR202_ga17114 [Eleusine coracana subsp. coracana]
MVGGSWGHGALDGGLDSGRRPGGLDGGKGLGRGGGGGGGDDNLDSRQRQGPTARAAASGTAGSGLARAHRTSHAGGEGLVRDAEESEKA